jgi:hypothetical protein
MRDVFAPDLFATPFERLSERCDRDFHRDFAINPDRVHLTR